MYKVRKRDGRLTGFDLARISTAVTKAFDATKTPHNPDIINLLTLQVTSDFASKVKILPIFPSSIIFFASIVAGKNLF